jgi:hypothetical protein
VTLGASLGASTRHNSAMTLFSSTDTLSATNAPQDAAGSRKAPLSAPNCLAVSPQDAAGRRCIPQAIWGQSWGYRSDTGQDAPNFIEVSYRQAAIGGIVSAARCHGGCDDDGTAPMLTDATIRKALPQAKAYKLADARGLYLYVSTKGAKSWRMKYRWEGREKTLTFGLYPDVKLAAARDRADEARRMLRDGVDPGAKPAGPATFAQVAHLWLARQEGRWSDRHAAAACRKAVVSGR